MVACLIAAACGDGIGTPIGRAALNEGDASMEPPLRDAAVAGSAAVDAGSAGTGDDWHQPRGFQPPPGTVFLDNRFCENAELNWPPEWAEREQEMYQRVSELRSRREFECQSDLYLGPGPLEPVRELRCSARFHSLDMVLNNFFMIANPEGGLSPRDRMAAAGFESAESNAIGILIEKGLDPESVLESLLQNNLYACRHLPDPRFDVIGIGYVEREGRQGREGRWTLDFAQR